MLRLLVLACLLLPSLTYAQEYSHGDPSPEEQLMLEMINRARMDPTAEGERLMDTDDPAVQQAYQYWTIDKEKTKNAFKGYPSRPPLAFHPALISAARLHSMDMAQNNFQGHVGSNGSQLGQRLTAAGYTSQGQYGENVASYAETVWYGHCGFNVDWGPENQIELGHRSNIMNFNNALYTEIGVGIIRTNGGLNQGTVGPLVITEDFGTRSVRYITGVVYDDKNHNGFYDIGEGIAGVKIQPSRGAAWAVSSTSGGYAIPFSGNGGVTLTASGGDLGDPIVVNTSFEGDNLKVDFVPPAQTPGIVVLTSPANAAKNIDPKTVVLQWKSAAFADSYEVQVATASGFTPATMIMSGPANTASVNVPALPCGTQVYWRVRGVNSLGNGQWSTPFSFTTSGKTAGTTSLIGPKGAVTVDNMGTVDCSWTKASDAERYHVRFSTNSGFTQVFAEDSAITGNTLSIPTSAIPAGTTMFYWSARSGNECGWGPWSGFAVVTLTLTDVAEGETGNSSCTIAPNPVTSASVIQFANELAPSSMIEVISSEGAMVLRTVTTEATSSLSLNQLTHNSLASGTYSLRVVTPDGEVFNTRFVVVR
ncbi:MAG: T9SS type A sorting domain-containing protein [Bradyrhizobiaceae bacterium]|nr:T9SS type A sorting domain-containing protein [Bradyrhizobiaceae bacterium]